jgi:hypothetical protein
MGTDWKNTGLCEQTVLREGVIGILDSHDSYRSHKFESCFWQILWKLTSKSHYSQDSHKTNHTSHINRSHNSHSPPNPSPFSHTSHTTKGIFLQFHLQLLFKTDYWISLPASRFHTKKMLCDVPSTKGYGYK